MISEYLGIDSDYIIIGLAGFVLILFLLIIIALAKIGGLKKKYQKFMTGKTAKSLEETLIKRLQQVDMLMEANERNRKSIEKLVDHMRYAYQKVGMVKYDAFHENGGKLSFSLALLNESNDGFIMNAVHSREGCYTYIKEVVAGNAVIMLSEEEKEALEMAKNAPISTPIKNN